jgi:hypothetical protein
MPQSDMKDPLFFDGSWGGPFKQSFISGSIAKAQDLGFEFSKTGAQLVEVGEDRAPLGAIGNLPRKLPFLGKIFPKMAAGEITKDDIAALKANGVNIISLDKITKEDSRLVKAGIISEIADTVKSPYIVVPTALIAAVYSSNLENSMDKSASIKQQFVKLAATLGLPLEGKIVFKATEAGKIAYDQYLHEVVISGNELTLQEKAKAVASAVPQGFASTLDVVAKTFVKNIVPQTGAGLMYEFSLPATWSNLQFASSALTNYLVGQLYIQPAINGLKAALYNEDKNHGEVKQQSYFERILRGVAKGIENSFPLLIEKGIFSSDAVDIVQEAANRWKEVLAKRPELLDDIDSQRQVYDQMVEKGRRTAIEKGVSSSDIIDYPSFDQVLEHLSAQAITMQQKFDILNSKSEDLMEDKGIDEAEATSDYTQPELDGEGDEIWEAAHLAQQAMQKKEIQQLDSVNRKHNEADFIHTNSSEFKYPKTELMKSERLMDEISEPKDMGIRGR